MSIEAVATTCTLLGIGVGMGVIMGASRNRSAIFTVTDLGVCLALHCYSPVFASLPIIKLIAENIIGCLAGLATSQALLGKDSEKKFDLPEAVGTHLLTIVASVLFIAMFVPSPIGQPVLNN